MRVVHKFAVRMGAPQTITVSPLSLAVRFAQQERQLCVWIDYDKDDLSKEWTVQIFGTGSQIPEEAMHLGSCESGAYIWHLYLLRGGDRH